MASTYLLRQRLHGQTEDSATVLAAVMHFIYPEMFLFINTAEMVVLLKDKQKVTAYRILNFLQVKFGTFGWFNTALAAY